MPRNGAGTYNPPAGQPVVSGTTVSSTVFNALVADLSVELTKSICTDGQTPMAADLPMGSNKITNLAAGTLAGDAVRLDQITKPVDLAASGGAGLVGYLSSATYAAGTIGKGLQDAVLSFAATTGATLIGLLRSMTGAVATTLAKWLGWQTIYLFDFLTDAQIALAQAGAAVDLTSQIQAALNAAVGKRLVINAGKFGLSYVGWGTFGVALDVPSNISIEFEPGASFESMAHNATIYQMMRVWDRDNVTIIRANLNGRKDLNAAVTGEFGMGIDIRGSTNVHIIDPKTNNMWGDGIYLGQSSVVGAPVNVSIDRPAADGCRRQGMSIVSGVRVSVNDPVWSNIGSVAPSAGLDIEPDSNSDELYGVVIRNPKTYNCTTGIQIQLANLAGAAAKNVDIQICGHIDNGSTVGFSVNGANTSAGANKLSGKIVSLDPLWSNNANSAFLMSEYDSLGPDVFVIRPTVVDSNRSAQVSPKYGAPFSLLRDTGSVLTYAMGGLRIIEASVILNSGSVPRLFSFQDAVNGISKVVDCHFIDPINLVGLTDKRGNFQGTGTVSDRFNSWSYNVAGSGTIDYNYTATIVSPNSSTALTLDGVTSFVAGSPDITIKNGGANSCIIATAAGGNLVGSAVGIRLQSPSGNAGSFVRLRPLGANIFLVMEKYGTWNLI